MYNFFLKWVCCIDLGLNEEADANIVVTELNDWETQAKQVQEKLSDVLGGEKLDGIFCVAGGWAGGNAANKGKVLIQLTGSQGFQEKTQQKTLLLNYSIYFI